MKRCALLALLLAVGVPVAAARHAVALDGPWRFERADVAGAEAPGFDDGAWPKVALPHTWNARDGEAGGAYYRGPAWYRLAVERSPARHGARSYLEFDGAALAADVWVNGQHAGRHEGGYARFRFDVTALLKPGRNTLAVRVDNGPLPTVAPLGGDFTVFGGLYRGVRLIETAAAHVDLLDHGGPGVAVDVVLASARRATLKVSTRLRNDSAASLPLVLRLTLRDARGRAVARREQALRVSAGSTVQPQETLDIVMPHLWQGVEDPYLYRLAAEVLQGRKVVDEVTLPVGLRSVVVDPERGILLNGRPYALHGVNYFHAGRPGHGLAVGNDEIDEDFRILQELGTNALRLVHFQHPQRAYERADELGLLLWTEIPLNAAIDESAAFRDNLADQLAELVQQNRHHASVAIWGLGNEVYRSDEPVRALLAALHAQAKQLDPTRPTAYAHCCAADDHPMALQADITGYNRYWGWYDGELNDLGPWADALHARLPQRALAISEYGAGGSALQQEDPPRRPVPNGPWHPESYQALFHEAYWAQIRTRPWLAGSFVWLAFDHASAGRREGDRPGLNDKGLVTYDRRMRKDAFHFYRAQWSRAPMVRFAGGRFTPRPAGRSAVKVYTNAGRVALEVNGVAVGEAESREHVAAWRDVPLGTGPNVLRVRTNTGATDTVVWEGRP